VFDEPVSQREEKTVSLAKLSFSNFFYKENFNIKLEMAQLSIFVEFETFWRNSARIA